MGEELILSVNSEWRRMRVFRLLPLLAAAVAATVTRLEMRVGGRDDSRARAFPNPRRTNYLEAHADRLERWVRWGIGRYVNTSCAR